MTLNELIRKANEITNQLCSGEIPIMHGDQEVWFDFKLVAPRLITDPWRIKIVNYREGEK